MCTPEQQAAIQTEMRAYDKLPRVVQKAFDDVGIKVSVHNTMRKPGFKRAFTNQTPEQFAATISAHFAVESARHHTMKC